jgi:AcrR family transcriptional regulator
VSSKEPKRDAILNAAIAGIARGGARGLRIEQVAEDAGVSQGLIYYHFTDRTGLLEATFAHLDAVVGRSNAIARAQGTTARERLELGLLSELDTADGGDRYTVAWNELRATAIFDTALRAPLQALTASWVAEVAEAIRAAQDSGEVAATVDAEAAAVRLTAMVEGLGLRREGQVVTAAEAVAQLRAAFALELAS